MLNRLQSFATGRNVLIFLILDLILMFGVMPFMGVKMEKLSENAKPLDLHVPTYSVETAHTMIEGYGEAGRDMYKTIELTADIIYPIIYSLAYALIILFVYRKAFPSQTWTKWLAILPFSAAIVDLGENLSIVSLINQFPVQPDHIAQMAGTFSLMKWSLVFGTMGMILVGLVKWGVNNLPHIAWRL